MARLARLAAHAADPDHLSVSWDEDHKPHAEILAYYDRYLETHPEPA